MAPSGSEITICPRKIRYTQDSIKGEFTDGGTMWDTLEDLLYGRISVDDLPLIEVVREDGKWWALTGNRRLYLYRKLEELKIVHTIQVITVPLDSYGVQRQLARRKTTDCEGVAIRLRGQNQPAWNITQVIDRWKTSQRNNRYVNEVSGGQAMSAERPVSRRGRSLERNSSTRDNSTSVFKPTLEIYPPSLRQGSTAHRSASIGRSSAMAVQPGSNRSAVHGQRPNIPDQFYGGGTTNPVVSSIRISSGGNLPHTNQPVQLDRNNSSRTGSWPSGGGSGRNYLDPPPVITSQPRSSTHSIKSSSDSCCSCCGDSCCSCCCCCCCFPCCKRPSE